MSGFSVSNYKGVPITPDVPLQQFRPKACLSCKYREWIDIGHSVCFLTGKKIRSSLEIMIDCPLEEKEGMNSEW